MSDRVMPIMSNRSDNMRERRKWALLIGNDDYGRWENKLEVCRHNAEELATILESIAFQVTKEANVRNREAMLKILQDSLDVIHEDDLFLFYFSGHGCEVNGTNYLLPTDDREISIEQDIEDFAIDLRRVMERITQKNSRYVTIIILDACRSYILKDGTTKYGLSEMQTVPPGTYVQYACSPQTTTTTTVLYHKHLFRNISEENIDIRNLFERIALDVHQESRGRQQPWSMNGLVSNNPVYLNPVISYVPKIPSNAKWKAKGITVAGGRGAGPTLDRLHMPKGICAINRRVILIADSMNHRVMACNVKRSNRTLSGRWSEPTDVIYDKVSHDFIICDAVNRSIVRCHGPKLLEAVTSHTVACYGLAIDADGSIYASNPERHEVRRYSRNDQRGKLVAGGNGQGARLHQLNYPTYIFVGQDQAVYVSDSDNDRVVRWDRDADEGVIVAGGHGKGSDDSQLDFPMGVLVDRSNTVYVADHWNNRIMRWRKGATKGERIAGRSRSGGYSNAKLNGPAGISFDDDGHLFTDTRFTTVRGTNADNRQAGINNAALLETLFAQPCFNGEFRFTRGKWPIEALSFNASHKDFLIRGSGAHLLHTGAHNFINITGISTLITNFILKELVLESNSSTGSILYLNGCQSSTIDSVTTVGGKYGIFLEQGLFDIHLRNSYVYGAREVGIFIGPANPIPGASDSVTNVEIFIDETRVHGCKTVSCCRIQDESCRQAPFAERTLYGVLIEGGNSGVYITGVSMAWTRRSGFAFNTRNQLMPSEYVFIRQSLVDSLRKYDDSDIPRGYEIESAADVSLSDNWAGSVEGDAVYINRLTRDQNSFLKLTDFRIINCIGNAFYFTGQSLNTVVMMGNNMMSHNGYDGIAGNLTALRIYNVSASISS